MGNTPINGLTPARHVTGATSLYNPGGPNTPNQNSEYGGHFSPG